MKSTKIFCRPSCPSRLPKKENIEIFYQQDAPIKAGYRPCKRCRPLNEPVSNQEWINEIDTILLTNYQNDLPLKELAYLAHGSESNLRHVYKSVTGRTPQQKLTEIRLEAAKKYLIETTLTIDEIAKKVGMNNTSYFIQTFRKYSGNSQRKYRIKFHSNQLPIKE